MNVYVIILHVTCQSELDPPPSATFTPGHLRVSTVLLANVGVQLLHYALQFVPPRSGTTQGGVVRPPHQ